MSGRKVLGTHPYAHPQHIKVVKHLSYIWRWCEMNMGWVYSLNHRISPSLISWELPRFLAKFQKLGRHERPYSVGDTSICTSTAYKGCQTPFIYMTLMWDEYGLGLRHWIISCVYLQMYSSSSIYLGPAGSLWGKDNWSSTLCSMLRGQQHPRFRLHLLLSMIHLGPL